MHIRDTFYVKICDIQEVTTVKTCKIQIVKSRKSTNRRNLSRYV